MSDKNALNARVIKREDIHDELMVLSVQFLDGEIPKFHPGQFGTLGLPSDNPEDTRLIRRAYSISSSNQNLGHVEYYITLVKNGELTPKLFNLKSGDLLWMAKKITGHFTLESVPPGKNLVLIGTGTGLGPYISMLRSFPLGLDGQKTTIIHGVRSEIDLGYREELLQLQSERPGFFYHPIVSRSETFEGWKGRVQVCWNKDIFAKEWKECPSPETTHMFLCGNPDMVKDMTAQFESEGFTQHSRKQPGQIHIEKYW